MPPFVSGIKERLKWKCYRISSMYQMTNGVIYVCNDRFKFSNNYCHAHDFYRSTHNTVSATLILIFVGLSNKHQFTCEHFDKYPFTTVLNVCAVPVRPGLIRYISCGGCRCDPYRVRLIFAVAQNIRPFSAKASPFRLEALNASALAKHW